jgi:retron-type reverse transcriptase
VLSAVYEVDFLGFSYGFRPGRNPHMALDALHTAIMSQRVNWVLDADIRNFFDSVDHEWLLRMVAHRIADPRILRLIELWLRAGVLESGEKQETDRGTPQGAGISPLLANIFLHYVLDLKSEPALDLACKAHRAVNVTSVEHCLVVLSEKGCREQRNRNNFEHGRRPAGKR